MCTRLISCNNLFRILFTVLLCCIINIMYCVAITAVMSIHIALQPTEHLIGRDSVLYNCDMIHNTTTNAG
jgi:hypothetical protein